MAVTPTGVVASKGGDPARLGALVRNAPLLVRALEAAREVDPPDWLICAGAIRDVVWDALHRRPPAIPRDVDVGFFDRRDLTAAHQDAVEAELRERAPDVPWQAKNQAAVHLWYPRRFGGSVAPFGCCAEAVATFPEFATCVGVRLLADDDLLIVAPHGLDDLLGCVWRHNPTRVSASFYERRVKAKGWRGRWPAMRYVAAVESKHAHEVDRVTEQLAAWARSRAEIRALAVVGSRARGTATDASDLDLVLLTGRPERFTKDDCWLEMLGSPPIIRGERFGVITERRVRLASGLEIEFGIGPLSWAATTPVDSGTRRVVQEDIRILHDPDQLLTHLQAAIVATS